MMPAREVDIARLEAQALTEKWYADWLAEHQGHRARPPKLREPQPQAAAQLPPAPPSAEGDY